MTAYSGEWVLSSILDDRAERLGERHAITTETGKAISFARLRDDAQRVAALLRSLGVQAGDRVATLLPNTYEYVAAWFGSCWTGAVEVPVNAEYKGTLLEHVLGESGTRVLIVQDRLAARLDGLALPDLEHVIVAGNGPAGAPPGVALHRLADAAGHDPAPRVPRAESELLYILYTSGTTGPSKGVMHANRGACWPARAWLQQAQLTPEDVAYTFLPLSHVTARSAVIKGALLSGGRVAMRERFSAQAFWEDVRAHGATCFMYVGAVIHFLCSQPEQLGELDNTLRVGGGAAAGRRLTEEFRRRFGCELLETYGSTEIGTGSSRRLGDPVRDTMGRPFEVHEFAIHDEHDRPVAPGIHGEIVVRPREPYTLMQGYWRRPDATVEAWRNLWFHTGDQGYLTPDGELVFVDRLTDSMRRRGENISSFEVERAVNAHPAVAESAAYPIKTGATEDEVMVAVVPRDGEPPDAEELLRFCVETMPRFAVPRYLRFVDALPKTATGRVRKHELRAQGVTADAADREAIGVAIPRA